MTIFHEQMKQLRADNEYRNVFPNDKWKIQDYKDMFWCIDKGYLVQDCGVSFMINEEWEGDDLYAEEFLEEEEEVELKEYNGVMLPKYINGREVLCYPNAGRFVEEKIEKCEKCDIRLGRYDGNYEMKVEWFGKTMCGKCAFVKAVNKLN
jgi:hypothetical protein